MTYIFIYVCSPIPLLEDPDFYEKFLLTAGPIHNAFAFLVFVGYFMANHPQLPNVLDLFRQFRFVFPTRRFPCAEFLVHNVTTYEIIVLSFVR